VTSGRPADQQRASACRRVPHRHEVAELRGIVVELRLSRLRTLSAVRQLSGIDLDWIRWPDPFR
jgi:hypothetical protein